MEALARNAAIEGSLAGTSMGFDRGGRHLAVIERDAVAVIELASSQALARVPITGAIAAACFDDQLWVVTAEHEWLRCDRGGRVVGRDTLPVGGVLVTAPCGPAAAVWTSSPPVALLDDFGRIVRNDVAADLVLPVTGRRHVTIQGSRLELPSRATVQLPPGTSATAGAITSDARSAVVLLAQGAARQLAVVSIGNARVTLRQPVGGTLVRIASRAMRAVARLDARTLRVVDLRSGRELGDVSCAADIRDLAIDPDAHRIVVRDPDGGMQILELGAHPQIARPPSVAEPAPSITVEPTPASRSLGGPNGDTTAVVRSAASREDDTVIAATDTAATTLVEATALGGGDAPTSAEATDITGRRADDAAVSTGALDRADALISAGATDTAATATVEATALGSADALMSVGATATVVTTGRRAVTSTCTTDSSSGEQGLAVAAVSAGTIDTARRRADDAVTAIGDAAATAVTATRASADTLVSVGAIGDAAATVVAAPRVPPIAVARLLALQPRPRGIAVDPDAARTQLDRELRGVMLQTLCAIASAWNTRRLGYGNEGKHPFELEVAAIVGTNKPHAEEYVRNASEQLAAHEREIAGDAAWRSEGMPITVLAAELGLSSRALDVMLVIAAPALHGEVARLYGILANDSGRPCVDELLVAQVLDGRYSRHDIAAELDPRAPLVRSGVVHVGSRSRPFTALTIDPIVLDRLRAVPPDLGDATKLRRAEAAIADLDIPQPVIATALAALARETMTPLRLVVRGRAGSGRETLLAVLAHHAGRELAVIDATALARDADRWCDALAIALGRAHLAGTLPCVANLDDVAFGEVTGRQLAREPLRQHPGPVAITCVADGSPVGAGSVAIDLPALAESARREVWLAALARAGLAVIDVDTLAARYRVGPGVIRRAVDAAVATAPGSSAAATTACEAYIRQTRDARLGAYARRVERLASWSSVVLPPDILDSLRELVARVRYGRVVLEDWGMSRVMQTSRGLTALFQGPPGTGKTLVAGVIARELGLDLYQVDLSKVMSKWIGETERNLATIFDAAEDGQVVLLFDEADSLFAKRTEVRSSNDRYANLEVNYLLQRLDSFEGIAILTTNNGTSIDDAFKRRLSFRLSFPFPDEETRELLWNAHLPPELPRAGTLELGKLARKFQLSGGYIRNVCLRAAFLAAQEETALAQHHLERAVTLEYTELGKLSMGGAIS